VNFSAPLLNLCGCGADVGDILCIMAFAFCIWKTETVHRTAQSHLNAEFKTLLLGIVLILGIASFLIPALYHSKKFKSAVL